VRSSRCLLLVAALAVPSRVAAQAPAAILDRYDFDAEPADRWELPRELDEVSGLASDGDELLAHGDEQAVIYRLHPAGHRVVGRFSVGQPALRGDFEGITVQGARIFLTTSDGEVYGMPKAVTGPVVRSQRWASGLGRTCEVEGLTGDGTPGGLLLGCKTARVRALKGKVAVFGWSPGRGGAPALKLAVPEALVAGRGREQVNPSELLRDPGTGHLLLLAARARLLVELSPAGEVLAVAHLKRRLHRQAEGLALGRDGALFIADEAAGARATLTTYRPVR
jgi:hypothetical protein